MIHEGFLGTRAPLIIDILAVSLVAVIIMQVVSLIFIKQKKFAKHKRIQMTIGIVMGIFVLCFELQMRIFGWRHLAEDSPYFRYLSLSILTSTPDLCCPNRFVLWVITIIGAKKNFPTPARPSKYSMIHKRLGKVSVVMTLGTCLSAWLFYWLAFAAS